MRNRPDGAAAKNRVFRGFAATGGTDFELIRYNSKGKTGERRGVTTEAAVAKVVPVNSRLVYMYFRDKCYDIVRDFVICSVRGTILLTTMQCLCRLERFFQKHLRGNKKETVFGLLFGIWQVWSSPASLGLRLSYHRRLVATKIHHHPTSGTDAPLFDDYY